MKKNGFAFIETIIIVVVLSTSLLYLYNSYSSIISGEETRLYYDDAAYIYKTNYIRRFLEENTDIESIKKYAFNNLYTVTVGTGFTSMFTDKQIEDGMITSLENLGNNFNVNQMIMIKSNLIDECNWTNSDSATCKSSIDNLSYNLKNYLKTLNDTSYDYYLVVEYSEKNDADGQIIKCTPGIDTSCISYYASLGI